MNWDDRLEVKKGNLGEQIVNRYLSQQGFTIYRPTGGPHPFDFLAVTSDKRIVQVHEIKTKPRRRWYKDTGIDQRHFDDYALINLKYNLEVFLFFVDEYERKIYGGSLFKQLTREVQIVCRDRTLKYPLRERGIVYFPLQNMTVIAELDSEQVGQLSALGTSKTLQAEAVDVFF